jgi:hypothetical protein
VVYKIATPPLAPLNVEGLGNPLPLSGTGRSDEDHHLQLRSHHLPHDPAHDGRFQWEPLLDGSRGDPLRSHRKVQGQPRGDGVGRQWWTRGARSASPPRQRQGLRPGAHAQRDPLWVEAVL